MKSPDGATRSSWYEAVSIPDFSRVPVPAQVDVCIVGAGIAGLTTAYLLALEGKSVAVLDEGQVGSGQTGRTSAHVSSVIDDRFVQTEKLHGTDGARLAHESHSAAIDRIEQICRTEKIDCDFARLDGFLTAAPETSPDLLDQEFDAAVRAGVVDVEKLATGGLWDGPCLRFGRQARFHPLKYLVGLTGAITKLGGKIHTGQRVVDVQGADPEKKQPATVTLRDAKKITAKHVVVATNTPSPINDWMGIYTKQSSYRTYMIAANVPRGSVEDALNWDTADPYHYVRVQPADDHDLLLIGGEDHKTGQMVEGDTPFSKLEAWAKPDSR